jgi:hypothetical protein
MVPWWRPSSGWPIIQKPEWNSLSDWTGISNRQFRRRFSIAVGYCPKIFRQVLRFQYLLNRATPAEHRPRFGRPVGRRRLYRCGRKVAFSSVRNKDQLPLQLLICEPKQSQ